MSPKVVVVVAIGVVYSKGLLLYICLFLLNKYRSFEKK